VWDADPRAFTLLGVSVEWYGILFAAAFGLSYGGVVFFARREGKPFREDLILLLTLIAGVIVGARLAHCLLYDPAYYLAHPLEILKVWKGGLASHGGALGIVVATWLFSRAYPSHRFLWLLDRISIVAALFGVLVRVGNFINSEIPGRETGAPYGVVFARPIHDAVLNSSPLARDVRIRGEGKADDRGTMPLRATVTLGDRVTSREEARQAILREIGPGLGSDPAAVEHLRAPEGSLEASLRLGPRGYEAELRLLGVCRHPVQLYEAAASCGIFLWLALLWRARWRRLPDGMLFGLLLVTLFGSRFILEMFKAPLPGLDAGLPFRMGQLVSLPFIAAGAALLWATARRQRAR
jgi:prolipoprotein diacylglyceryltransferase